MPHQPCTVTGRVSSFAVLHVRKNRAVFEAIPTSSSKSLLDTGGHDIYKGPFVKRALEDLTRVSGDLSGSWSGAVKTQLPSFAMAFIGGRERVECEEGEASWIVVDFERIVTEGVVVACQMASRNHGLPPLSLLE